MSSKSKPLEVTGHFTQLVWKDSTELGIGFAIGNSKNPRGMKCVYVVARYKPAGNSMSQFRSKVSKGSFDEATYCGKNGKPNQSPDSPSPKPKIGQSTGLQLPNQTGKPNQALSSFLPAGTSSPRSLNSNRSYW